MRAVAAALLAAGGLVTPAMAEMSKSFTVSATITNGCLVASNGSGGSWGSIDLGTVSGIAAQTASANLLSGGAAGLQLECTPGLTAAITADQGLNGAGGTRRLVHAADAASLIPYQLYANGSTTPWTTDAVALSFPVGTSHLSLPVRAVASIPGAMRGGTYSDTVRVTIAW
jgi:spore coat protein U-like protein